MEGAPMNVLAGPAACQCVLSEHSIAVPQLDGLSPEKLSLPLQKRVLLGVGQAAGEPYEF
jgi:hypothetical protein